MTTAFPTGLDAFTNPGPTDTMDAPGLEHDVQHSNLNDALEALQVKVGINESDDATSLDYLVKSAVNPGHTHSIYADINHDHSGVYSSADHTHDYSSVFAPLVHNHDSAYAALGHDHNSVYTALTGNQTIAGVKTFSSQIVSSVTTGTAPLSVASTTAVTNLNADMVDGIHGVSIALADHTHTRLYNGLTLSPIDETVTENSTNYRTAFDMATQANINAGVTDSGYRAAARFQAYTRTGFAGTLYNAFAFYTQYGNYDCPATGRINNAYGIYLVVIAGAGTIDNSYGLYLGKSGTGGTITNEWGIYQTIAAANNAFAGKVRLGSLVAPTVALDVTGEVKVSSNIQAGGYKSSDGTAGGTLTFSVRKGDDSGAATITVKNGLVTGIA